MTGFPGNSRNQSRSHHPLVKIKVEGCYMKRIKNSIKFIGVVIIIVLMIGLFSPTWTQRIKGENSISVMEQVEINGSNHEMMIRGNDKEHPVIIVVHGGPGSPEM